MHLRWRVTEFSYMIRVRAHHTNKMICIASRDTDLPGHPLIFNVSFVGRSSSGRQQRLWSDYADAHADLRFCCTQRSFCWLWCWVSDYKQVAHDKTNKMACAPSDDSDQPGHPPSLIRVFTVRMKKALFLSYPLSAQQRLWSDWADAQADLSLRWAHSHFVGFVMMRLIYCSISQCLTSSAVNSGVRTFNWVELHSRRTQRLPPM